jgi:predicted Kef-type K+ transport protein
MKIIGLLMVTLVLIITILILLNQIRNMKQKKHVSKTTFILTMSVIYAKKGLFFIICILIGLVSIIYSFLRGMGISRK